MKNAGSKEMRYPFSRDEQTAPSFIRLFSCFFLLLLNSAELGMELIISRLCTSETKGVRFVSEQLEMITFVIYS